MTERTGGISNMRLGARMYLPGNCQHVCVSWAHARVVLTWQRMTEVLRGLLARAVRTLINVAVECVAPSRARIIERHYGFYGRRGYECV